MNPSLNTAPPLSLSEACQVLGAITKRLNSSDILLPSEMKEEAQRLDQAHTTLVKFIDVLDYLTVGLADK